MKKLALVSCLLVAGCGMVKVDYYPETGEIHAEKMGVAIDTDVAGFEAVIADGSYVRWDRSISDADRDAIEALGKSIAEAILAAMAP